MPAPSGAALRAKAPPFGDLAPLGSYVRTAEGWLYVAAILDLYSRRIVRWATGASLAAIDSIYPTREDGTAAAFDYI